MRWLIWAALLLLGVPLAFLAWDELKPLLIISGADRALQKRIAASDTSLVYVLSKDKWTEFSIPKGSPSLRVVTNATLPNSIRVDPTSSWPYVLQYEFLDGSGKVLLQRDYAYRASVRQFQDKAGGPKFSPSFYLEPRLMPADGHIVVLNLLNLPEVVSIRVRILSSDPSVRDVAYRAYVEKTLPDFRLAHRWLRLSDEQKVKLAKGNVYPQDMLAENEIRNLLRGQEQPLGPTGFRYDRRTLYVMRTYEGQKIGQPVLPAGVYVDENTHGVIPLPEGGGKVRLSFASLGLVKAPEIGSTLQIRWYGRLINERSQTSVTWRGEGTTLSDNWKGGLLEVVAPGGVAVRAFQDRGKQQELEITPEAMYLRTFSALPGSPVDYTVDHVGNDPTPFRMDIRHVLIPGQVAEENPVWVTYQLLNQNGAVVREGSILATPPLSAYERLMPDTLGLRVSDPSTYYFSLPADVTAVRLVSDSPALLTGYTRPWDLVRESRVPEDAFMADDAMERQISWFPLRPRNFQSLVMANRSMLLATQYRPPLDNPDMLAGRYQWQDFHPQGAWLGRTLFTPMGDFGPLREDALPGTYQPLAAGKEIQATLLAPRGVGVVQPNLAYFRKSSEPFEVKLFLDGRLHHQARVAGGDGEIMLPALRIGSYRVRVVTSAAAEFYLNYTAPRKGSLLKRLGNRFKRGQLGFNYLHGTSCEETLGMRLFTPQDQPGRSVLRVWVAAPRNRIVGPLTSWSFINRRFDVRPETLAGSRVAAHRRNATDQGQPFFMPLAPDLPPGKYTVHVELERGPGGYLLLSRIVPGLADERKIFVEQELRHVEIQE